MQSTSSEPGIAPRARRLAGLACALTLGACAFRAAPDYPRPALSMPMEAREQFALPGPVQLLKLDPVDGPSVLVGDLACGPETVHFHLYKTTRVEAPVVLLVPILGGGEELLRTMARRFVQRGYHAIYCDRAGSALRPPQRGPELQTLLIRTVLHQRMALAWTADCQEVRPLDTFA